MYFSIIIPVYNEENNIKTLLESLKSLELPSLKDLKVEILIVDNNSKDNTINWIKKYGYEEHIEMKKGSYAARNLGIDRSKGEYLIFIDGDCQIDSKYIGFLYTAIKENDFPDLIAGGIYNNETTKNIFSIYDDLCFLNQAKNVSNGAAVTANLVVKRTVFDTIGKFNDSQLTGSDFEFVKKATKLNYRLIYLENLKVYHKSRDSFKEIHNKFKRFATNSKKYDGKLLKRVLSLAIFPGIRTLIKAYKLKKISSFQFFNLILLSFFMGCSVLPYTIIPSQNVK